MNTLQPRTELKPEIKEELEAKKNTLWPVTLQG